MRTLILAVGTAAVLATSIPAAAMLKCPQADGSVLSVPESMGCSTEFERAQQRAEEAAAARRRQAEQAADGAQRAAEARQQQGADFIRASQACTQQANRHKFYNDPSFKAVANPDGTVRTLGTATDRFDYETCMEQAGHPLDSK
jgi:hypothetical protein